MLNNKKEIVAVLAPVAWLLALAVGLAVNAHTGEVSEIARLISAQINHQN